MHHGTWHGIAVLLAMAPFPASAPAQQMYRCGSTYSQTPCGPTATATRTRSDVPPDNAGGSQAGAACSAQAPHLLNVPDPAALRVLSTSASRAEVIQYSGQPVVALRYDLSITTVSPAGVWLAARAYSCYLSEDQQRILKFEIRRQ
jgi:hypothetical protein